MQKGRVEPPHGIWGAIVRMPLAVRLSLLIGGVLIVAMFGLTAVRVRDERRLLEENMAVLLGKVADLLGDTIQTQIPPEVDRLSPMLLQLVTSQTRDVTEQIEAQFAAEGNGVDFTMVYAFIADPDGRVLSTDQEGYLGQVLTQTVIPDGSNAVVRVTDWTGLRVFEAAIPIENKVGRRVGLAYVGLSTEMMDQVVEDIVRQSVQTTLIALLVAIALTVFLTRRAVAPVVEIAQASEAVAWGDLEQSVPETRWDEVGQLARAFNAMVHGLRERERLRDLFGRFVSREVSEAVLAGRVSLRGERRVISALYCDMRGSTAFAETHSPEVFMAALNQYFGRIVRAVEAEHGIVNRFVGDEAVCLFGAPIALEDHAERAVRAALRIRAELQELSRERTEAGLPILRFGCALNTGEVVAGATGTESRQEYTVLGDAMNVGARIEALNKNYPEHDILLSEFTRQALGARAAVYHFADLGEVQIRGKSQPVRILGLVGTQEGEGTRNKNAYTGGPADLRPPDGA